MSLTLSEGIKASLLGEESEAGLQVCPHATVEGRKELVGCGGDHQNRLVWSHPASPPLVLSWWSGTLPSPPAMAKLACGTPTALTCTEVDRGEQQARHSAVNTPATVDGAGMRGRAIRSRLRLLPERRDRSACRKRGVPICGRSRADPQSPFGAPSSIGQLPQQGRQVQPSQCRERDDKSGSKMILLQ